LSYAIYNLDAIIREVMMSIGVTIKLLHEAVGHVVTIELKNGELYRGYLLDAEDSMNCRMETVTITSPDGRVSIVE
jgi:small nuclear ribonucleoprotein D3